MSWCSTILTICVTCCFTSVLASTTERPTILISVVARNEEKTLPTFLGYIDELNYPKHRISILFQTDHNEDNTPVLINEWTHNTKHLYHRVTVRYEAQPQTYKDALSPTEMNIARYEKILESRQFALEEARQQWSDYLLQVNAGNFLMYRDVLDDLINSGKPVVAPMLKLFDKKSGYSNYWADMDEKGYYKRHPKYYEIFKRNITGTFEVPLIHSTVLIDMRDVRVNKLQYHPIPEGYTGETDDILVFAWSAKQAGLKQYICNQNKYGYMMGLYTVGMSLAERHQMFTDIFIDYVAYNPPLIRSNNIKHVFPEPTKKGFDEIFMINLVRRVDRNSKMNISLRELGISYKHYPAVDGKNLTQENLTHLGIKAMADFKDPYLERPLTFGEIGCFLSHWFIWLEQIEKNLDMVLVLEDDVRFEPDFNNRLNEIMTEARDLIKNGVEWDILYLGRKPLVKVEKEPYVSGCNKIVWAKYSYWTLGYILRLSGAKQLVDGDPRDQLIPVDEYIPIKFNECFEEELLMKFSPREMIGFSAAPLALFPTHYVGDDGYFSDTEDTLSFEGKDVQIFRDIKDKEEQEKAQKEKAEKAGVAATKTVVDESPGMIRDTNVPVEAQVKRTEL